jgi:sodium/potassium-transporting ATPase subunit alpha
MDEKQDDEVHPPQLTNAPGDKTAEATQGNAQATGDHRIQFASNVKPSKRPGEDDAIAPVLSRRQSATSIPPQYLSEKEKDRREREKEEERNVNITEHLMTHQEVADKYKTKIDLARPGESQGLSAADVEQRLVEHGLNVLTPPSKRHPFLKFLDCLSSLFNLLLIVAGILEYILLGIDFKDNFQNVRFVSISSVHFA